MAQATRSPQPAGASPAEGHVSVAHPGDRSQAIATVVAAFVNDPVVRWVYPEPGRYLTGFADFVDVVAGPAFDHGTAFHIEGFSGAAFWLPPGEHYDEEAAMLCIERTVAEHHQPDVFAFLEALERHFPREPVWYLPFIGVDPSHQGRGLGSSLLTHALAECDARHMPAYLESSNPRNIPLYQRHGFEVVAQVDGDGRPPIWPMYRPAR